MTKLGYIRSWHEGCKPGCEIREVLEAYDRGVATEEQVFEVADRCDGEWREQYDSGFGQQSQEELMKLNEQAVQACVADIRKHMEKSMENMEPSEKYETLERIGEMLTSMTANLITETIVSPDEEEQDYTP